MWPFFYFQCGFTSSRSTQDILTVVTGKIVNGRVPQGSILGPTLFLLCVNDLLDDIICNIAIYADHNTLYSKCAQTSDLWQQLKMATDLESDLQDTVEWGRKQVFDFNAGKSQRVSFDWSNN